MSQISSPFSISWDNPALSGNLSAANILEYFCNLTNPFYDRECNNEVIRMQRLNPEQLINLTGIEYYLHHVQEPILYVIRKQYRTSPTEVTPLAYYYVISGTVLQAPDLSRLYCSRLQTVTNGLNKCFKLLWDRAEYYPVDGNYFWKEPQTSTSSPEESPRIVQPEENVSHGSMYQIQKLDYLIKEWAKVYPSPNLELISNSEQPTPQPTSERVKS